MTRPPLKHLPQRLRRKVRLLVSLLMLFLSHQLRQFSFHSILVKYHRRRGQSLLVDRHQDLIQNKIRLGVIIVLDVGWAW